MQAELHRLSISSQQAGAVFRVTDGRSVRVGTGMYRLDLDLPQGLYTISTLLGASVESKTVLLDHSRTVDVEVAHGSFGDAAFALAPRIRARMAMTPLDAGLGTVVALRGPFVQAPAREHRIGIDVDDRSVEPVAEDTMTDDAGGVWTWQIFRFPARPGEPGIVTATRSVDGTPTSHVIPPCCGGTVWAAYPAPVAVAARGASLPLSYYVRLRLSLAGVAPDLSMQCLSDQVFTALANRSALPLSPPVLELLFATDADPLLALAAAHVASLTLAWHGLVAPLPLDEAISKADRAEPARAADDAQEPTPPAELLSRVRTWLGQLAPEFTDWPDVVAVKHLYGLCDQDIVLHRPPVLLRSLDALIRAEHEAAAKGRSCELGDRVWRSRFQVSDAFALLQWETDTERGEQRRRELLEQSFAASQALQRSLDTLRERSPPQAARSPQSFTGNLLERAEQAAAIGRHVAADKLADLTGSTRMRARATQEFETYLKLNAQALRLPSSAIGGLAEVLGSAHSKPPT